MTREENKQYYLTWLKKFFTEEEINLMFKEQPINETVVKISDRKEGLIIDYFGDKILILYRAENSTRNNHCGWVGIKNNKQKKLTIVPTKYITAKNERRNDEQIKNFIQIHYRTENNNNHYESGGEKLIEKALIQINFNQAFDIVNEYKIPELVTPEFDWVEPPRFDFAVLNRETHKPLMFLEYDGEQHYAATEKYPNFWKQLRRDNIKNAYAFYSLIPLIRIPHGILYEDDNIDKVAELIISYLKTIDRATPKILNK